ncbi:UNC93-like protein [Ciona intestinalis]
MHSGNKAFYVLSFGVLLNVSAYAGILNLQSSINIEHNLGTLGASIMYLSAAAVAAFIAPVLLRTIGAKWSLIIGEACFIPYSLMNFHPAIYTVIPCAVLGSLGEGVMWSASIYYVTQLVYMHWSTTTKEECSESRSTLDEERNKWFGTFYGILKTSLVFGNLVSYAVLYGAKNLGVSPLNGTSLFQHISHCGSNYQTKQTNSSMLKYVPASRLSVYLLTTLFTTMQIGSTGLLILFLPKIKIEPKNCDKKAPVRILVETVKATFYQALSIDQLLLTPICFYFGLLVSYAFSNFTAGFVSCTIGVQQVGLVMATYGCFNCLAAIGVGKVSHWFGVAPIYVIGLCFDSCSMITQLFWTPTPSNKYWVYAFGCLLGVSDGIWQTTTTATITSVFAHCTELAIGAMEMWIALGMFCGFLLGGRVVIFKQIYLLLGLLYVGCAGYAISVWRNKQKEKLSNTEMHKLIKHSVQ